MGLEDHNQTPFPNPVAQRFESHRNFLGMMTIIIIDLHFMFFSFPFESSRDPGKFFESSADRFFGNIEGQSKPKNSSCIERVMTAKKGKFDFCVAIEIKHNSLLI